MENYLLIECLECNTVFRKQDVEAGGETVFCECNNLTIGPKKVENSKYPYYLAVTYSRERPRIYELKEVDNEI